jgi:hypothetical protein
MRRIGFIPVLVVCMAVASESHSHIAEPITVDLLRNALRNAPHFDSSTQQLFRENPTLALVAARAELQWKGEEIAIRRSFFVLQELGSERESGWRFRFCGTNGRL